MRIVFMAKSKRSAARALDWLVLRGCEVPAVVASEPDEWTAEEQRVDLVAARHDLPLLNETELYAAAESGELGEVDLVVSFLFWNRIRRPLISLGRLGCINLHPAPLPDLRGVGGYNVALLEGHEDWGVSCHFVDDQIDTGDLIEVDRFPIDASRETALSLDVLSQDRLLELFRRVVEIALAGDELPREPQGEGRYVSRAELEELRVVRPGDDLERKVRAFWYPPWPGAVVELEDRRLTLVDDGLLGELARAYRASGVVP
jgi:methionyl-tRNA formyltransferase